MQPGRREDPSGNFRFDYQQNPRTRVDEIHLINHKYRIFDVCNMPYWFFLFMQDDDERSIYSVGSGGNGRPADDLMTYSDDSPSVSGFVGSKKKPS